MVWPQLIALVIFLAGAAYPSDKLFLNSFTPASAPQRINEDNLGVLVTAKRYAVIDLASGQLLVGRETTAAQPIASITKLLTALVILDLQPDWQSEIIYSPADETAGAQPKIYRGEAVSFANAWRAALVASDNNSIMAMIRALGMSRDEFAELMNDKARELGLVGAGFSEPTGLSVGNRATVLDVAKLLHAAMQRQEIRQTVSLPEVEIVFNNSRKTRTLKNTDILLNSFLNHRSLGYELVGGKTGFINEAGYCLAVWVKKDGRDLLAVVLDSDTIEDRFQDVKALVDWSVENYSFDTSDTNTE